MTPGSALLATLRQVMDLVATLPAGAQVAVTWPDASPDLILVLAQQSGAELRSGDEADAAEWACGNLTIRAQRSTQSPTRAALTLVKP